jgi:ketosteroid isomerase-like protein
MRTPAAFAVLLLVGACQTAPPEMTEAEKAQIQTEVLQAAEDWFDGFRQHDLDMLMAAYHPTETSFSGSRGPRDYATVREGWGNQFENIVKYDLKWTETMVKVLSRDAAMFQGYYDATCTYVDGRILQWPGNANFTVLMERTPDGWKITTGSAGSGTAQRIDQVYGTYDFSKLLDSDLPNDTYASATLEWRTDGTWTVTATPADGSEPFIYNEGDGEVGPGSEGCIAVSGWGYETPESPFTSTYCDGLLTADDGTWIAQQRR